MRFGACHLLMLNISYEREESVAHDNLSYMHKCCGATCVASQQLHHTVRALAGPTPIVEIGISGVCWFRAAIDPPGDIIKPSALSSRFGSLSMQDSRSSSRTLRGVSSARTIGSGAPLAPLAPLLNIAQCFTDVRYIEVSASAAQVLFMSPRVHGIALIQLVRP